MVQGKVYICPKGEDKNKCNHSVSWEEGVGKNVREGHEGRGGGRCK